MDALVWECALSWRTMVFSGKLWLEGHGGHPGTWPSWLWYLGACTEQAKYPSHPKRPWPSVYMESLTLAFFRCCFASFMLFFGRSFYLQGCSDGPIIHPLDDPFEKWWFSVFVAHQKLKHRAFWFALCSTIRRRRRTHRLQSLWNLIRLEKYDWWKPCCNLPPVDVTLFLWSIFFDPRLSDCKHLEYCRITCFHLVSPS